MGDRSNDNEVGVHSAINVAEGEKNMELKRAV